MALLGDSPKLVRIILCTAFCAAIYLLIVVGGFRLREPLRLAHSVVQDRFRTKR
jgi:hypothetical protein